MQAPQRKLKPAVLAEAAEWFALLASGSVSKAEQEQWQAWLAAQPEHRAAWQRVELFTDKFSQLPATAALAALTTPDLQRRQTLKNLAMLCGVGLLGWQSWRNGYWQAWTADYRTEVGEISTINLADGTTLSLDTASAVNVDFSDNLRRLQLVQGEVYIATAADKSGGHRPLVVDCSQGRVQALGTRFSVREHSDACHAAVYQGAIRIQPASVGAMPQTLTAGQSTDFRSTHIDQPKPLAISQPAWSQGMLLADNMPLSEFVLQLSRYRHGLITCAPDIANLRIVGAFPLQDPDRILAALQATLPIQVSTRTAWWVRIEGRG